MISGAGEYRPGASSTDGWAQYLDQYHAAHPGITEKVLCGSSHPEAGTPYAWLRAEIPRDPGDVLDLACGSAPMHPLLPDAASYLGIDLSEAEIACGTGRGRGPLLHADALALPLPDQSVDVVVCSMAVMLLRPVESALAEVARVLRPGGRFVSIRPVGTPFHVTDLRVAVPLLLGLHHLPEMPQRWSGKGLRRLIGDAGLGVITDDALRFAHPLESVADAHLAVEALYLPHVRDDRRRQAADRLARYARAGRELPISLRRTVAVRA